MGRESHGHDPTVVHSSIALLQERFRQLQRVKEMREERELLRMLTSETKQLISTSKPTTTTAYELPATMSFFHPETMIVPSIKTSPPHPHVSLSLWPTSSSSQEPLQATALSVATFAEPETPPVSMTLSRPTSTTQSLEALWKKNAYDCDGSDSDAGVDTSLHL